MTVLDTSAVLLLAGYGSVEPMDVLSLDESASWVLDACEAEAGAEPTGGVCVAVVASIWAVESSAAFLEYPSGRWTGSGVGPMQLARPVACWRNTRIGTWCPAWHEVMGGASAVRLAVDYLRVKWHPSPRRAFRRWNGGGSPGYEDRALRVLAAVRL